MSKKKGIIWRYVAPYSPTTTEIFEKFNRTFMGKLRKMTNYGQKDWAEEIENTTRAYMNSYHRAIGGIPQEAWLSKRKDKDKHREKYKKSYGKGRIKQEV